MTATRTRQSRADDVDRERQLVELRAQLTAAREQIGHLQTALQTRQMIGTAVGILIEHFKITLGGGQSQSLPLPPRLR